MMNSLDECHTESAAAPPAGDLCFWRVSVCVCPPKRQKKKQTNKQTKREKHFQAEKCLSLSLSPCLFLLLLSSVSATTILLLYYPMYVSRIDRCSISILFWSELDSMLGRMDTQSDGQKATTVLSVSKCIITWAGRSKSSARGNDCAVAPGTASLYSPPATCASSIVFHNTGPPN